MINIPLFNREKKAPKPDKAPIAPNNGDSTPPNNGPSISRGDCFYNKKSRKLYQVTGFEEAKFEDGRVIPLVVFVGVDSKIWKLHILQFLQNYQKTLPPEYSHSTMKVEQDKLHTELNENSDDNVPLGSMYEPSDRYILENMIIYPNARESIMVGVDSISKRKELEEVWGLSKVLDESNRTILNFFGPPGCGKTMAARALARKLGKKLFQVDYSQIVDKYVGETGKKISQAFAVAKEKGAILFFDEADSLLSKRVDMSVNSDYANSVNNNRNILMQELDKFDDIVIMSTNFFNNYDEAMLRRINRHIEFKVPNAKMREDLFKIHIPNLDRASSVDFSSLAIKADDFSGGDIKNVCVNAMESASKGDDISKWILTQELLEKEIQEIKDSKESHRKSAVNNGKKKPFIGFSPQLVTIDT